MRPALGRLDGKRAGFVADPEGNLIGPVHRLAGEE
jgi:hypothetical protein